MSHVHVKLSSTVADAGPRSMLQFSKHLLSPYEQQGSRKPAVTVTVKLVPGGLCRKVAVKQTSAKVGAKRSFPQ